MVALDRNVREVWALLRAAADENAVVRVPAAVIGQVWRDGARQALLARALRKCEEVPLDGSQGRAAGRLCGVSATADVIDATVALVAAFSDQHFATVLTSDASDFDASPHNFGRGAGAGRHRLNRWRP
ncbi:MAG: twitching motility protein PilT [Egibacteraceae bacterium]